MYCTLKGKGWDNRGFLFGPWCPIYGAGVMVAVLAFKALGINGATTPLWAIFLISMAGSAVLEYATSYALERWFHARWWDYRDMPLNLNGRICLPAACLFGCIGVLIAVFLLPAFDAGLLAVPHVAYDVAALGVIAMLSVDATLSISAMTQLVQKVETAEDELNARMERWYRAAMANMDALGDRLPERPELPALPARPSRDALAAFLEASPLADAASTAKKLANDSARSFAKGLSSRQRRVLVSMKSFGDRTPTYFSEGLADYADWLRDVSPGSGRGRGGADADEADAEYEDDGR